MASFMYNRAIKEIMDGTINLDTDTLKLMLVNSTYAADPDQDFIDLSTGTDAESGEITATNYTRGFGGAGRKTVSITISEQDANNRGVAVLADTTWTALGGATNDTVVAAVLVKEITNDAASKLIAYFDITDTPTNGSDFTLDFDATDGNIRFTG